VRVIPQYPVIGPYIFSYRFRWVFCQLEVLRDCFPATIRRTLDQLPKSLDETYVRVLSQIPEVNQAHAHRMLQCLMVAVRPLYVEELAELLAFDFDAAEGEIPKYRAAWRLDDQTQAVLATCSTLVTIVRDTWGRQVVQFSHFSVKEFLISNRLTSESTLGDVSRYHLCPISAHTVLTQACLGLLLHLDDHVDKETIKGFPLVQYAARHWVEHARFEDVAHRVKGGIETLFEPNKPHFATWIGIYDIDTPMPSRHFLDLETSPAPAPNPLYYSVLCGLYDLVKHLAIKHPQNVNAVYGKHRFPLLAALSKDHIEVAELLLDHGANVDARDTATGETILLKVLSRSQRNHVNIVGFLLKHGADVNARDGLLMSSLHLAEDRGELKVAQILLEHNADTNFQNDDGKTPLHLLSQHRRHNEGDVLSHALSLLKCGAEVNIRDKSNKTPLHLAIQCERFKLAGILLENGADATAENNQGETPLHVLSESLIKDDSEGDIINLVRSLLKLGAELNRRDKDNETPLHLAIRRDRFRLAGIRLEHGADANTVDIDGMTPLHISSDGWIEEEGNALNYALSLLKHGADAKRRDNDNETPLHLAIRWDRSELAGILESQVESEPSSSDVPQAGDWGPAGGYPRLYTPARQPGTGCINNPTLPPDTYVYAQADFVRPQPGGIATPGCPGDPEHPHQPLIQSHGGPTYEFVPPHVFERPPLQAYVNLTA
jgi:ankyrin repeat protein